MTVIRGKSYRSGPLMMNLVNMTIQRFVMSKSVICVEEYFIHESISQQVKDNGSVAWQTHVFRPQSILGVDRDEGKHVGDWEEDHQLDLDQCEEEMRDGGDI